MKINKLVFKILFLYIFIFSMLFLAFFLLRPFSFDYFSFVFITLLNIFSISVILFISTFVLLKNSNRKNVSNKNCDIIYWICSNIPFILYLLNIITSISIIVIFKEKISFILSLLSIFAFTTFYIFSERYFKDILNYSEKNYRLKTVSITNFKKKSFISDISLSTNIIFEILPLLVTIIFLCIQLNSFNISSIILIFALLLLCILSVFYIAININLTIFNITNNNSGENYNGEFGNLAFKINTEKQIYYDYINKLNISHLTEIEKEHLASVEIIRRTVDAKDTYTRGHSDRVSEYSVLLGKSLELSKEDLNSLKIGGLFHDIGKIGIPDSILKKEGNLTNDEYSEIKKHPSIGAHIIENSTIFKDIVPIILYHHEKFDGTGYPKGLKGSNIPILARIVAVADTFDAMTSKRSYRNAISIDIVKNEFIKYSGTQFDSHISSVFLDILNNNYEEIEKIQNKIK